jgi:hypothetical protein
VLKYSCFSIKQYKLLPKKKKNKEEGERKGGRERGREGGRERGREGGPQQQAT